MGGGILCRSVQTETLVGLVSTRPVTDWFLRLAFHPSYLNGSNRAIDTLQSSSGDSLNHEKRVERIIHNLCCAESWLDPFWLAALTQEPLTKCLFGRWDNEYQSDRNFSTIFDKLSQGQAVEGFSLFQGKLRHR